MQSYYLTQEINQTIKANIVAETKAKENNEDQNNNIAQNVALPKGDTVGTDASTEKEFTQT